MSGNAPGSRAGKHHSRQGPARRANKGHPRREARRQRAVERLSAHVCGPTCKRFRKASAA